MQFVFKDTTDPKGASVSEFKPLDLQVRIFWFTSYKSNTVISTSVYKSYSYNCLVSVHNIGKTRKYKCHSIYIYSTCLRVLQFSGLYWEHKSVL